MATLYVIRNGFDLHHGMATSHKHFGEFLKRDHPELRDLMDEYSRLMARMISGRTSRRGVSRGRVTGAG